MGFITCMNADTGRFISVHYSAVILIEETEEGGSLVQYRAGNSALMFKSSDKPMELLNLIRAVRFEDINSFDR